MSPNTRQKRIARWLRYYTAKPICAGVIHRAIGASVLHEGQLADIRPGHRLPVACILCNVVFASRAGRHTKDSSIVRILPCPFHFAVLITLLGYVCPLYGSRSLHCLEASGKNRNHCCNRNLL